MKKLLTIIAVLISSSTFAALMKCDKVAGNFALKKHEARHTKLCRESGCNIFDVKYQGRDGSIKRYTVETSDEVDSIYWQVDLDASKGCKVIDHVLLRY